MGQGGHGSLEGVDELGEGLPADRLVHNDCATEHVDYEFEWLQGVGKLLDSGKNLVMAARFELSASQ